MSLVVSGWEKALAKAAFEHIPLTLLLIASVIVLAVIVTVRYNQKVNRKKAEEEEQKLLAKQQVKLITIVGKLPCVSKANATQLADPNQDSNFPDQPECSYVDAIKKGDV
jgi:hypothetical protein